MTALIITLAVTALIVLAYRMGPLTPAPVGPLPTADPDRRLAHAEAQRLASARALSMARGQARQLLPAPTPTPDRELRSVHH